MDALDFHSAPSANFLVNTKTQKMIYYHYPTGEDPIGEVRVRKLRLPRLKWRFRFSPTRSIYALGALILVLSVYSIVGERGAFHLWRLRAEKVALDEQNYRTQRQNETLRQRIARLRNDDSYLEKIAREELNLVRPGETVYRFAPAEPRPDRPGSLSDYPAGLRPPKEQKQRR
jgi:cell division protein FtsB